MAVNVTILPLALRDLSFNLGAVITCDCPTGLLLGSRREWLATFKYAIKVSPFISACDATSMGGLKRR